MSYVKVYLKDGSSYVSPEENIKNIHRLLGAELIRQERCDAKGNPINAAPAISSAPVSPIVTPVPAIDFSAKTPAQLKAYAEFMEYPKEEWEKLKSKKLLTEYLNTKATN